MDTREIAAEYRLAHWSGILNERRESGLSIKAYCENAGIRENTYFYWQRKLREAACEGLAGTSAAPSGFLEVKLEGRPTLSPPAGATQGHVSIEAPGIRITAGSEYPSDKLAALLREVVRPC